MNNILTIFKKQMKETLKNKTVLIQFIMFPVLTIIMENAVKMDNMPEHFFTKLFAVMFVGMSPLTCMSSIIAEEKEKKTLRVLMMSNVSPVEYLIGVGAYILLFCMAGAVAFGVCGGYGGMELVKFFAVMLIGIILSMLVGAIIGVSCKNQMTATSITVPVMMVFSFLPMLSMFNQSIEKVAKFTYSQQINILLNNIGNTIDSQNITIIAINLTLAIVAFFLVYRKHGLE